MLSIKQLAQSALFIALLAISAHIKIPIGLVPITFQVLVVTLTGLLLNRKQIIYTFIGYILLGLIGLPVFASGSGIGYLSSPSFGFILGFMFFALTISAFKNKVLGVGLGYLVLYVFGLSYLTFIVRVILENPISLSKVFIAYWVPFLLNDILSLVLALILHKRLKPLID